MRSLFQLYDRITRPIFPYAQSAFLLFVRLYWGWQLIQTGWGKLHHIDNVVEYFQSLNIPMASFNAHFVSGLELVTGILFILGLGSRLIAIPMTINLFMAYWFGDRDSLFAFFSDPGKFYAADPFTFLFASIIILLFGPGMFSVDELIHRALASRQREHSTSTTA